MSAPLPPVKVLIVDDEAAFADVLAKRLAKRGLAVQAAYSGAEAVRILRHEIFDVAVLDLKMEDMDGLELLAVCRRMAPEMRVIMLTGHSGPAEARMAYASGVFDYIHKPCALDDLAQTILDAAGLPRTNPTPSP